MFAAIKDHALRDAPREACGLVCRRDGDLVAIPSRNTAQNPGAAFRLDIPTYLQSLHRGECVGYYHSHPVGPAWPSAQDRLVAEHVGLPCFIYSIAEDRHTCYRPEAARRHALEGRPHVPLVHDAVTLVEDWCEREGLQAPRMIRTGTRIDTDPAPDLGRLYPQRHDVLLIALRGSATPNHAAIYIGNGMILHQPRGSTSTIEPWQGPWRAATTAILRPAPKPTP